MMLQLFLASVIVMLAAFGGAVAFWQTAGRLIDRHLNLLISFTAGLFLFVTYELAREAVAHADNFNSVAIWFVAGMILIWLPFKLVPLWHHHHDIEVEDQNHSSIDIRRILTGNAIHNIGDGVLLAAAWSVNWQLGLITTVSVFIHELIQETSTFFVLRRAGLAIATALLINFAVSGTILIGALGGGWLLETFLALETPLLALSAGAFLVVVMIDLVPHSIQATRINQKYFSHLLAFVLGLLLMVGVTSTFGHDHDVLLGHDHDHDNDYDHTHDQSGGHDHNDHGHDDDHHDEAVHAEQNDHHHGDNDHDH